jgi:hypothetical protein
MRCRDRNPGEAREAERPHARVSRSYFEEEQKLRRVRGILKNEAAAARVEMSTFGS